MIKESDLPSVKGTLSFQAPLAPFTWMRVGGPAGAVFRPRDENDLANFLKNKPDNIPYMVIGAASNLIIRDGGLPDTVVIQLGKAFRKLEADAVTISVGAGQLDLQVARFAAKNGIGGLSFLAGVPGTIGGAVRMNAGAKSSVSNAHIAGGETADRLISARVIDPKGKIHNLTPADMGMSYRHNSLPTDWIVTSAVFEGYPENVAKVQSEISEVLKYREENQPTKARTCGSTFKNPQGISAWKLIDQAGGRGLKLGDAEISSFHCNFLLNLGGASASDLEDLGENIRSKVQQDSGVLLEWEVQRVGVRP